MRGRIAKSLVSVAAAVALAGVAALASAPADAAFYHGGGGFHGGFHAGGWGSGGGWRGGWAHPGWGWGGRRWYGGHWNNGWWWGPALAGGLIVGATYPYWGDYYGSPYYGYDNGCWVYRRVYNRHHHYIGRMLVNICD